jgi:hypothetical protein
VILWNGIAMERDCDGTGLRWDGIAMGRDCDDGTGLKWNGIAMEQCDGKRL